ncbi:MAG: hypothetical protein SFZ03_04985 [Candidatus Melainabacteria bacterium]|nr:hypothetical protein [Candidatus Melainabacteria bacterium]
MNTLQSIPYQSHVVGRIAPENPAMACRFNRQFNQDEITLLRANNPAFNPDAGFVLNLDELVGVKNKLALVPQIMSFVNDALRIKDYTRQGSVCMLFRGLEAETIQGVIRVMAQSPQASHYLKTILQNGTPFQGAHMQVTPFQLPQSGQDSNLQPAGLIQFNLTQAPGVTTDR